jgi:N-methylhydantoinase B
VTLVRDGVRWDGINHPYLPGDSLDIDPSLSLHSESAEMLDPITYEVLRYRLWHVNEEHGETLLKVSGSPIALYGHDFNTTLTTEDGEIVYFGPYIQHFSGMADLVVKWTLENRSGNPGIRDGDMFISCDPWVASSHQMDNYLLCPVFWEGKLFCWVISTLHVHESGGTTPGSFCPDAKDAFWEPTSIPPLKYIEAGELRRDVEEMFVRRSRLPELTALDLRAQAAGAKVARDRMLATLRRYGATTVKGVMRKVLDDCEQDVRSKLARIPDGTWRDVQYIGIGLPGDRNVYRLQINVTKEGEQLTIDNAGTDPQFGSMCCTAAGWRAAVLESLNPMLTYEHLYATGGLLRAMDFRPVAGTITCASYPASVTMFTAILVSIPMATRVLSKMLACDLELRRDILTSCGLSNSMWTGISGQTRSGGYFGTVTLDQLAGAIGAFSHRDGISTGGVYWDPMVSIANCEVIEREYPLLYLYRSEVEGGGGSGRWRGGDGISLAFVPHGVDAIQLEATAAANTLPSSPGLFGGAPGASGWHFMITDSGIQDTFASSSFPGSPAELRELDGTKRDVAPKTREIRQDTNAVWEMRCMSGGGYGDPLVREPARVAEDVAEGWITTTTARTIYGVETTASGVLDESATDAARRAAKAQRLERSSEPARSHDVEPVAEHGPDSIPIHECLRVERTNDGGWVVCSCGHALCRPHENYKEFCAIHEGNPTELGVLFADPATELDADIVLREFYCPSCAVRLEVEIVQRSDAYVHDIEIRLPVLAGMQTEAGVR